jgi:tetratricopeptide (TPR) repeat protein
MLMRASSGAADFGAADQHAAQAAQIADRYDLPVIATRVSFYRAMRAALAGDASAEELYQRAGDQMDRLGMWAHGNGLAILGRFCLRVTDGRVADSAADLEPLYNYPPWTGAVAELYALALAAAGRPDEARAAARRAGPARQDFFWLFLTGVRGLLAAALGHRERGESAYRALLPFATRPAGADTAVLTLWPAAQILGDLARRFDLPGAQAHYQQALAIAEQAGVTSWAQAARQRLAARPARR